jgi:hypothetical protein
MVDTAVEKQQVRNMVSVEDLIKMYRDEQRKIEELERIKSLTESICVFAYYLSGEDLDALLSHLGLTDEAKEDVFLYRAVVSKTKKKLHICDRCRFYEKLCEIHDDKCFKRKWVYGMCDFYDPPIPIVEETRFCQFFRDVKDRKLFELLVRLVDKVLWWLYKAKLAIYELVLMLLRSIKKILKRCGVRLDKEGEEKWMMSITT